MANHNSLHFGADDARESAPPQPFTGKIAVKPT
jgi:hypothetical protein